MIPDDSETHVAILLSTYNGERYLRAQLDSIAAQTHGNWTLYWRDDGSCDGTGAVMADFAATAGPGGGKGRCVQVSWPAERLRPTRSFMTVLRAALPDLSGSDMVAFADQDDVWLPQKLARGIAALRAAAKDRAALYCARQMLVDAELRHLGLSHRVRYPPAFPAALTQNVVTGCTIMLNACAARLIAESQPGCLTLHDWWCYLLVAAAGGKLVHDAEPVVLYRQHADNMVGAPRSMWRRAIGAMRRGPGLYMTVLRQHVAALHAQPHLVAPECRAQLDQIALALRGGVMERLRALRMRGLHRQTWAETLVFRVWFLIG